MITERTSAGLDMLAASIVAAAIGEQPSEIRERRFDGETSPDLDWVTNLHGLTGFGFARAVRLAGIRCAVAALSRSQRPTGDRVKTDQ